MLILMYTPGPPSRSDALLKQLARWLVENGHSIGYRYFGAYNVYEPCDIVITIGWNNAIDQIHKDHMQQGKKTLAFSDGFVRRGWSPGSYFAVTRNGLHAYGDQIGLMPGDRWQKLDVKLRPWQINEDGHILIAHQHTEAFDGHNRQPWFHETLRRIRGLTDRLLILRPHPRDKKRDGLPPGCLVSTRAFRDDLEKAYAVVTYDSNMAVDALLYGIPVFTGGKTKADPLACFDIERINDPLKPDRQQWAHDLAYCQWSVNELRAGFPWRHLIGAILSQQASGLVHQVEKPAMECDFEYAESWDHLEDSLTDWNVKDHQTPEQVLKEIANPKIVDAIHVQRARFTGAPSVEIVRHLIDNGLRASVDEPREQLIERAVHASL